MPTKCPVLNIISFSFPAVQEGGVHSTFRDNKTKAHKGEFAQSHMGLDSKADMSNFITRSLEQSKAAF